MIQEQHTQFGTSSDVSDQIGVDSSFLLIWFPFRN
jgi:hypothetical protein